LGKTEQKGGDRGTVVAGGACKDWQHSVLLKKSGRITSWFIAEPNKALIPCALNSLLVDFFGRRLYNVSRQAKCRKMDEEEYNKKYANLRILKSIQAYLKDQKNATTAVYPIKVPDDLLYQVLKLQGPETADKLINHIFELGLNIWSDNLYDNVFGSEKSLEDFIELVKNKNIK
jgi:hypothetical protein